MLSFSARDIYQMAENLERNGRQFYTRAAALSAPGSLRDLFLLLAEMEEAHRHHFHVLLLEQGVGSAAAVAPDAERENRLYLQAMADAQVFATAGATLETTLRHATPLALLDLALDCEKESIVFYLTLQELLPPSAGRTVLEEVIHEELRHIRQLRGEKDNPRNRPESGQA